MANDYDRLLKTCLAEFEALIASKVEAEFAARRKLSAETCEVPFIGGTYSPHAPAEQHAGLIRLVVRALCARKWFELEAGQWAQPLPLSEDEAEARLNTFGEHHRRCEMVAHYAAHLRGISWDYQRAVSFEQFAAAWFVPAPEEQSVQTYPRRGRRF
jgi:hypothetical protein